MTFGYRNSLFASSLTGVKAVHVLPTGTQGQGQQQREPLKNEQGLDEMTEKINIKRRHYYCAVLFIMEDSEPDK